MRVTVYMNDGTKVVHENVEALAQTKHGVLLLCNRDGTSRLEDWTFYDVRRTGMEH